MFFIYIFIFDLKITFNLIQEQNNNISLNKTNNYLSLMFFLHFLYYAENLEFFL